MFWYRIKQPKLHCHLLLRIISKSYWTQYPRRHKSPNVFRLTTTSPSPLKPLWSWEFESQNGKKTLPKKLTIATMEGVSTSLKLKVEIETTDTTEKKSIIALLDSGTMGECIDRDYAKSQWFNLLKLTNPIPVYNIDRSPNEVGLITEVVSLILRYKNHSDTAGRGLFCGMQNCLRMYCKTIKICT